MLNGYDGDKPLEADSIAQINNFCIEATFTDDYENDLVAYSSGRCWRARWRPTRAAVRTSPTRRR